MPSSVAVLIIVAIYITKKTSLGKKMLKALLKEIVGYVVDITLEVVDIASDVANYVFVIFDHSNSTLVAAYTVFLALGGVASLYGLKVRIGPCRIGCQRMGLSSMTRRSDRNSDR